MDSEGQFRIKIYNTVFADDLDTTTKITKNPIAILYKLKCLKNQIKKEPAKAPFYEKEIDNLMEHYKFPGEEIAFGSIETDKINT